MKQTEITRIVSDILETTFELVDEVVEEWLEPMMEIGNPEKLLGPYESWGPQEYRSLYMAYGNEEAEEFLAKKLFEEVKEMESEEV
ncbi:MAG: hypothetical protein JRD89_08750 [Deltaproteobacteria bacterium]|nr:hypothetical protein [Deltaproteobacteria bacterium]